MKKFFAIIVFVFGLIACCPGNKTEQTTTVDTTSVDSIEVVDSVFVDSIN